MAATITTAPHLSNLRSSGERPARRYNGYVKLLALLLGLAVVAVGLSQIDRGPAVALPFIFVGALLTGLISIGFDLLQPNQAAAILLFGSY